MHYKFYTYIQIPEHRRAQTSESVMAKFNLTIHPPCHGDTRKIL